MRHRNIIIVAVSLSTIIFIAMEWIQRPTPDPTTILTVVRQSVTLNDGRFDYLLNLTSFESEFPYLQSYQCSTIYRPRKGPQDDTVQLLVLLAIKSHPGSGDRRNALRQTWAREQEVKGYRLRPIFLMAMTESSKQMAIVEVESQEYGDILQWDFTEGHHNLSLKERCFLEWLHHHMPQVAFVFKGDDDEFVNTQVVVKYITQHGSPNTIHGFHQRRPAVMRHTKYRISPSLYPQEKYPGFVSGGGFLFPGSSVRSLVEASRILPVFPLDDVYFGFLALAANLTYRHDHRFYVNGLHYDACKYKDAIVVHGIYPEILLHIWKDLQENKCKTRR